MNIIKRLVKGSELTPEENDNNFTEIEQEFTKKLNKTDTAVNSEKLGGFLPKDFLKNNEISIDGFKADFKAISGTIERPLAGDLALNRKISESEFVSVSIYIGNNTSDFTKSNNWRIVSSIINIGPEEID